MKLWGGRFTKDTNELVDRFNASITFDQRFWREDIEGSIAHVAMLAKQEIITEEEKTVITDALNQIKTEIADGTLVISDDNEDIHSFEDLKGKTTANSLASTYMELAESYGATVQGIDTLEETIQLLTAGRIDATLNADVSFYDYLNVHPDADFKLVAQTAEASHVAIPVLKSEDTAYLDALNTAIEELRADGTLKTLSEKYFGQDISSEN